MKTKLIRLFVALVWLALPALVQAQFSFTTNNGAITITGYNTAAGLDVVIPAMTNGYAVIGIGVNAFRYSGITNVIIPNSVTNIEDAALANCPSLASITADAANPAFSTLGGVLFDKAQATLLQFPGGLGGSYAIPHSVTGIGKDAFDGCYRLTSVTIPDSVTSIGYLAFIGCTGLTSVTIPGSVTNVGQNAFEQCESLTSVTLGSGVTSTGDYVFVLCSSLTSVTIPNSVTNIGTNSFYGCGLTSVTIPDSVTRIAEGAFEDCTSLTNIAVDAANPAYRSLDGVLFDKAQATLLQFPGGLDGRYIIPNSVASIGDDAFVFSSLTNVTIPFSVTRIGDDAFAETSLTSVTIPNSVTNIGTYAFADTLLTTVYFQGNPPPDDGTAFASDPATAYYLPGTSGWGSTFGGVPAVLWNPQATAMTVTGGQFGFTLTGPSNAVIVVEACTNLSHPVWLPLSTNTLSGLGTSAFSDPTGYPMRYYRFRSP